MASRLFYASKTLNFFHLEESKEFFNPKGGNRLFPEGRALLSPGIIFVLRGDWNYFWHWDQAFLSWGRVKKFVLRGGNFFGTETERSEGRSAKKISTPKDKIFFSRRTKKPGRSAKKISSRPEGQNLSRGTTKPNLRDKKSLNPPEGFQSSLVSPKWKKFKLLSEA